MATHSSIMSGEFHGQRSLVGYSPWRDKPDMSERLSTAQHNRLFQTQLFHILSSEKHFCLYSLVNLCSARLSTNF